MLDLSFERAMKAVEDVRRRLLETAAALERNGIPYAVIGGNAVAAWVARVDPNAVRTTADVDILLNRSDWDRATAAMSEAGYDSADIHGTPMFLERSDPSPKRGIHVIYAGETVRPADPEPAPIIANCERSSDGFSFVDLRSLLIMKLSANRKKDHVHIEDMLELGMISAPLVSGLHPELQRRLEIIRAEAR